jgi:hypothetical protein
MSQADIAGEGDMWRCNMRINIGTLQDEVAASAAILKQSGYEVGEALLLPPMERLPGVYEVWFAVDDQFLHVTVDGIVIRMDSILPEHY